MGKYAVLSSRFNVCPDFSRRPHQTVKDLFRFRNAVAHGKSQNLEVTKRVRLEHEIVDDSLLATWEEYCTLKNARRARDDVSKAIKELHVAAGLGDNPFQHGLKKISVRLSAEGS